MTDTSAITDLIYEASINAELWPQALDRAGRRLQAVSGELIVFGDMHGAPKFKATDFSRAALSQWVESGLWQNSVMQNVARAGAPAAQAGVLCTTDMLSQDDWNADPTAQVFQSVGLHDQLFAPIFMPTGAVVFFSFERLRSEGRFAPAAANNFADLLPHFSRAALVSSQLRLERAHGAAQVMELLGLPAAVLSESGKVISTNSLFSLDERTFASDAWDKVRLKDSRANMLFQTALREASGHAGGVRSIAVRATENSLPAVVHVLPLRRSAHEILFGADILVAVTEVGSQRSGANSGLLIALFDLTPTEARIASLLAGGSTITAVAVENGITRKTARSYLERIFVKTGCHRQSDLVQLLRDVGKPELC